VTDASLKPTLLGLARASIKSGLGRARPPAVPALKDLPGPLAAPGASFVTLTHGGQLRGCRGTLEPRLPLAHDVWRNAWASAFDDPRFEPVSEGEFDDLTVAVSLLSPLEPVAAVTEEEIIAVLEPHRHGLVIAYGEHRATFLPQVWSSLPTAGAFLGELKAKAGLPRDFWSPAMEAWRYTTETFREEA
jgi:AmmeMemoRadiSam system protein A